MGLGIRMFGIFAFTMIILASVPRQVFADGGAYCYFDVICSVYSNDCINGERQDCTNCHADSSCCGSVSGTCVPEFNSFTALIALVVAVAVGVLYSRLRKPAR
jgi:hypothetical protein